MPKIEQAVNLGAADLSCRATGGKVEAAVRITAAARRMRRRRAFGRLSLRASLDLVRRTGIYSPSY